MWNLAFRWQKKTKRGIYVSSWHSIYSVFQALIGTCSWCNWWGSFNWTVKKIFLEEDQENDKQKDDAKGNSMSRNNMPRNNILPQRLATLKRAHLPNSRVFFAKYKRVNNHALAPTRVRINRTYVNKVGPRRQR